MSSDPTRNLKKRKRTPDDELSPQEKKYKISASKKQLQNAAQFAQSSAAVYSSYKQLRLGLPMADVSRLATTEELHEMFLRNPDMADALFHMNRVYASQKIVGMEELGWRFAGEQNVATFNLGFFNGKIVPDRELWNGMRMGKSVYGYRDIWESVGRDLGAQTGKIGSRELYNLSLIVANRVEESGGIIAAETLIGKVGDQAMLRMGPHIRRAIASDPMFADSGEQLGRVLDRVNTYKESLRDWGAAVKKLSVRLGVPEERIDAMVNRASEWVKERGEKALIKTMDFAMEQDLALMRGDLYQIVRKGDTLMVTFKGTNSLPQWIGDANVWSKDAVPLMDGGTAKVFSGFSKGWDALKSHLLEDLDRELNPSLAADLRQGFFETTGVAGATAKLAGKTGLTARMMENRVERVMPLRIQITGHSRGNALAERACLDPDFRVAVEGWKDKVAESGGVAELKVVTANGPATMDEVGARYIEKWVGAKNIIHLQNEFDPLTRGISGRIQRFMGATHPGENILLPSTLSGAKAHVMDKGIIGQLDELTDGGLMRAMESRVVAGRAMEGKIGSMLRIRDAKTDVMEKLGLEDGDSAMNSVVLQLREDALGYSIYGASQTMSETLHLEGRNLVSKKGYLSRILQGEEKVEESAQAGLLRNEFFNRESQLLATEAATDVQRELYLWSQYLSHVQANMDVAMQEVMFGNLTVDMGGEGGPWAQWMRANDVDFDKMVEKQMAVNSGGGSVAQMENVSDALDELAFSGRVSSVYSKVTARISNAYRAGKSMIWGGDTADIASFNEIKYQRVETDEYKFTFGEAELAEPITKAELATLTRMEGNTARRSMTAPLMEALDNWHDLYGRVRSTPGRMLAKAKAGAKRALTGGGGDDGRGQYEKIEEDDPEGAAPEGDPEEDPEDLEEPEEVKEEGELNEGEKVPEDGGGKGKETDSTLPPDEEEIDDDEFFDPDAPDEFPEDEENWNDPMNGAEDPPEEKWPSPSAPRPEAADPKEVERIARGGDDTAIVDGELNPGVAKALRTALDDLEGEIGEAAEDATTAVMRNLSTQRAQAAAISGSLTIKWEMWAAQHPIGAAAVRTGSMIAVQLVLDAIIYKGDVGKDPLFNSGSWSTAPWKSGGVTGHKQWTMHPAITMAAMASMSIPGLQPIGGVIMAAQVGEMLGRALKDQINSMKHWNKGNFEIWGNDWKNALSDIGSSKSKNWRHIEEWMKKHHIDHSHFIRVYETKDPDMLNVDPQSMKNHEFGSLLWKQTFYETLWETQIHTTGENVDFGQWFGDFGSRYDITSGDAVGTDSPDGQAHSAADKDYRMKGVNQISIMTRESHIGTFSKDVSDKYGDYKKGDRFIIANGDPKMVESVQMWKWRQYYNSWRGASTNLEGLIGKAEHKDGVVTSKSEADAWQAHETTYDPDDQNVVMMSLTMRSAVQEMYGIYQQMIQTMVDEHSLKAAGGKSWESNYIPQRHREAAWGEKEKAEDLQMTSWIRKIYTQAQSGGGLDVQDLFQLSSYSFNMAATLTEKRINSNWMDGANSIAAKLATNWATWAQNLEFSIEDGTVQATWSEAFKNRYRQDLLNGNLGSKQLKEDISVFVDKSKTNEHGDHFSMFMKRLGNLDFDFGGGNSDQLVPLTIWNFLDMYVKWQRDGGNPDPSNSYFLAMVTVYGQMLTEAWHQMSSFGGKEGASEEENLYRNTSALADMEDGGFEAYSDWFTKVLTQASPEPGIESLYDAISLSGALRSPTSSIFTEWIKYFHIQVDLETLTAGGTVSLTVTWSDAFRTAYTQWWLDTHPSGPALPTEEPTPENPSVDPSVDDPPPDDDDDKDDSDAPEGATLPTEGDTPDQPDAPPVVPDLPDTPDLSIGIPEIETPEVDLPDPGEGIDPHLDNPHHSRQVQQVSRDALGGADAKVTNRRWAAREFFNEVIWLRAASQLVRTGVLH